jgi:hypothetical protein
MHVGWPTLTIADWCSLTVSVASLGIAIASTFIAKRSLTEAKLAREQGKEIADRAHDDWAQQKWFDLYFKVDQVTCPPEISPSEM